MRELSSCETQLECNWNRASVRHMPQDYEDRREDRQTSGKLPHQGRGEASAPISQHPWVWARGKGRDTIKKYKQTKQNLKRKKKRKRSTSDQKWVTSPGRGAILHADSTLSQGAWGAQEPARGAFHLAHRYPHPPPLASSPLWSSNNSPPPTVKSAPEMGAAASVRGNSSRGRWDREESVTEKWKKMAIKKI